MKHFQVYVPVSKFKVSAMGNRTRQKMDKLLCPFLRFEANERSARSQRRKTLTLKILERHPDTNQFDLENKVDAQLELKKYKPKLGKKVFFYRLLNTPLQCEFFVLILICF